jgi:23S rRNA (cytosine1962-C5)-methyltransferase
VLDLFCYTGGFSLNALKHGQAGSTLGIDTSAPALALAQRNADGNGLNAAKFERGDVFKILERLKNQGACFDVVICDPPKYAHRARDLAVALKGYRRLNLAAVGVLAAGGILATCSCSGLIDRPTFAMMLGEVAAESGRPIQILEERGQPPDHPISAACLESDYLKCFICAVGS